MPLKELGQAQDLMETSTIAGKIAIVARIRRRIADRGCNRAAARFQ